MQLLIRLCFCPHSVFSPNRPTDLKLRILTRWLLRVHSYSLYQSRIRPRWNSLNQFTFISNWCYWRKCDDSTWYDMIWYDTTRHDTIRYDIRCRIRCDYQINGTKIVSIESIKVIMMIEGSRIWNRMGKIEYESTLMLRPRAQARYSGRVKAPVLLFCKCHSRPTQERDLIWII